MAIKLNARSVVPVLKHMCLKNQKVKTGGEKSNTEGSGTSKHAKEKKKKSGEKTNLLSNVLNGQEIKTKR